MTKTTDILKLIPCIENARHNIHDILLIKYT